MDAGRFLTTADAQVIMDSVSMLESAAVLLPEHEIGMRCQAHLLRNLHAAFCQLETNTSGASPDKSMEQV